RQYFLFVHYQRSFTQSTIRFPKNLFQRIKLLYTKRGDISMAQIYPFQSKHKRPSAQTTYENKKTLLELIEINKQLQIKNDLYELNINFLYDSPTETTFLGTYSFICCSVSSFDCFPSQSKHR